MVNNDDYDFNKSKAKSIINYLVNNVENVEDGDLTVDEVAGYLKPNGNADDIATEILDRLAEDNSRLDYNEDNVYEIAKIIRKRKAAAQRDKEQSVSLNEKKAAAILDYLLKNCDEFEENDVAIDEIVKILDANGSGGVDDTATELLDYVAEENSRFDYSEDDVYEVARIVRKKYVRLESKEQQIRRGEACDD